MIVVDSSAWVELLRRTESRVHSTLQRLLDEDADLAVTEIVVIEILQGARSEAQVGELRETLLTFPVLPLRGLEDYVAAAALFRACRRGGETLRRTIDCLVAVPTIEARATLLQADRDFEILARHTPLELEPLVA